MSLVFDKKEIYTTGAYLQPLKVMDDNGKERWVWCVTKFEESNFQEGLEVVAKEYSDSLKTLILK